MALQSTTSSSSILRRAALLLALLGAAAAAAHDGSSGHPLRTARTPSPSPSHWHDSDSLLPASPSHGRPFHGLRQLEYSQATSGRSHHWEFKLTADDVPSAVGRQALRVHV